ncbi:MAG TPA: hypothetical protein VF547_11170 [Allosphingosinicella sp.]|jgi:hypothetical protein
MHRRTLLASILVIGADPWLMGEAAAQEIRIPAPTREQTAQAIAACGVPAANVRITYEVDLESDLVSISDLGGTDEARFRCLKRSVHPVYLVDVSAAPQSAAYRAFADREDRRKAKAEAIAWLDARGKLGKVPRYDPAAGLDRFARDVEAACGVREGIALETFGRTRLGYRRRFFDEIMETDPHDQFLCLHEMVAASDADKHEIDFMFLGKAAPETESPR